MPRMSAVGISEIHAGDDVKTVAVLDIGTSNIRATAVDSNGSITAEFRTKLTSMSPTRGFVEFDAEELFQDSLTLLKRLLSEKKCSAMAITNQRASAIVFDPETREPVCMGQSWQDLRTAPMCLALKGSGISLSPNQSASKIALMMDLFDKDRKRGLAGGTIDGWLAFRLTGKFATDHTNAAMTGLVQPDAMSYDEAVLSRLKISTENLAEIRPSIGNFGEANIDGALIPLVAILGDQQASMLGQGITRPGRAKATFGTGAMVDIVTGDQGPSTTQRLPNGTFPIVARSQNESILFGLEAIGLHAGSAVQFACDGLGIADDPSRLEEFAAGARAGSAELFVPALTGLATPYWDFGALACFVNLSKATTRADLAKAVLAGVSHVGADLVEAIEADGQTVLDTLSVDGGMTRNHLFLQLLSNLSQKRLKVSSVNEATSVGAGFAALLSLGYISEISDVDRLVTTRLTVEPDLSFGEVELARTRDNWRKAVEISRNSVPELSSVTF
ncbi:MAG: FGGY family carbohydrate kinase [Actinomycetota bacterium]|nr:FGGY family carbohydrate kinase [Actinomycetota bacterium]